MEVFGQQAAVQGYRAAEHRTGQLAAAAANMVGLAYIAAAQQRADDAGAILDEAGAIATSSGADRILAQVNEARANLPQPPR